MLPRLTSCGQRLVRTTASTPSHARHIWENDRITFANEADDEYDQNIQVSELNILNAALAVIKWKKLFFGRAPSGPQNSRWLADNCPDLPLQHVLKVP